MGIENAKNIIRGIKNMTPKVQLSPKETVTFAELQTILEAFAEPEESEKKQKGGKRGEN